MEITPTRSALLEFKDDRHVMAEGYRFLDEKRLLLAAEIVVQLERYHALHAEWKATMARSVTALAEAVERHGLEGVQVYPVKENPQVRLERQEREFFGVRLVTARLEGHGSVMPEPPPVISSPEAETCRRAFADWTARAAELAAVSGNLHRLLYDYRRTERRARALEDVILPELDAAIGEIDVRLEELEQEESVRVRLGKHE